MDKNILEQYIDACELIKETEEDIRKLKRKKAVIQDSVKGSNPDFPYQPQSFHIEGTREEVKDKICLEYEEKLLKERKANAERIKLDVESWMNTVPMRMQRIIRMKVFRNMEWKRIAEKLGRGATENSIKKEWERFFK